jgi:hypothetical protein
MKKNKFEVGEVVFIVSTNGLRLFSNAGIVKKIAQFNPCKYQVTLNGFSYPFSEEELGKCCFGLIRKKGCG